MKKPIYHSTHSPKGYSLLELLVAVAVVALIVTVGVPSFVSFTQNNKLTSEINQTASRIAFARSEASKRPNITLTACVSTSQTDCTSGNWEDGWILMVDENGNAAFDTEDTNGDGVLQAEDLNGNGALDAGEDTNGNGVLDHEDNDNDGVLDQDEVILVVQPLGGTLTLRTNGFASANNIQFDENGSPGSTGTMILCDDRGSRWAKALSLTIAGQVRMATDDNNDNILNLHDGGGNISCP